MSHHPSHLAWHWIIALYLARLVMVIGDLIHMIQRVLYINEFWASRDHSDLKVPALAPMILAWATAA